jgi:hypothetical protein
LVGKYTDADAAYATKEPSITKVAANARSENIFFFK